MKAPSKNYEIKVTISLPYHATSDAEATEAAKRLLKYAMAKSGICFDILAVTPEVTKESR